MPPFNFTIATAAVSLALTLPSSAQEFGTQADADYAALLWEVMEEGRLVGDDALYGYPYEGTDPHGALLETFYTKAIVDGHTGRLVLKRNYGPEGVEIDEVVGDPVGHLGAITVMFQRETGYDAENRDWFWVKYLPDGTLDKNPGGTSLAGRVAKGADVGCIACHSGEDDYIFTSDAVAMIK